jgi:hypothetical protein
MPELLEEAPVRENAAPSKVAPPTHEAIELRAYFRYVNRGCVDGCALDDWLAAEEELRRDAEVPST